MAEVKKIHSEIAGFTWLKCLLPICVILIHCQDIWNMALSKLTDDYYPSWQDILFMNVFALAVPLFLVMSLYLYTAKRKGQQGKGIFWQGLRKRIAYLCAIFFAWRCLYACFGIGALWIAERGVARNLYHWILGGGDTSLYFLEILIALTIAQELMLYVFDRIGQHRARICAYILLLGTCLLMAASYYFPYPANVEALRHFSPIAFLPYPALAWLLYENKNKCRLDWILILIGILLAYLEWTILPSRLYLENGYSCAIPSYARLSNVFFTAFVVRMALRLNASGPWARIIASLSLPVYCFHQIFITTSARMENASLRLSVIFFATYAGAWLYKKIGSMTS